MTDIASVSAHLAISLDSMLDLNLCIPRREEVGHLLTMHLKNHILVRHP